MSKVEEDIIATWSYQKFGFVATFFVFPNIYYSLREFVTTKLRPENLKQRTSERLFSMQISTAFKDYRAVASLLH